MFYAGLLLTCYIVCGKLATPLTSQSGFIFVGHGAKASPSLKAVLPLSLSALALATGPAGGAASTGTGTQQEKP